MSAAGARLQLHLDEPFLPESVEYLVFRRVRDGQVRRVGNAYLCRGRPHLHEPIEVLVMVGLLAEADPVAGAGRAVVLTDPGLARYAQLAPPDAEEVSGCYVRTCCGHRVDIYAGDVGIWTGPCPNCDKPGADDSTS